MAIIEAISERNPAKAEEVTRRHLAKTAEKLLKELEHERKKSSV